MTHSFKAKIYKTGINWAVDVPQRITRQLEKQKGYIRIKGTINGFKFSKSLVPVKDAPYRLFVNAVMMKEGNTAVGKIAAFEIVQGNKSSKQQHYPVPQLLSAELRKNKLTADFRALTPSRKKDILRYLGMTSKEETLRKNVEKVIRQLREKKNNVRIP